MDCPQLYKTSRRLQKYTHPVQQLHVIDSHTAGEPTRLVLAAQLFGHTPEIPAEPYLPSHSLQGWRMPEVRLTVNRREVRLPAGSIVAAAIAIACVDRYRRSVAGEARAPLCGMGI